MSQAGTVCKHGGAGAAWAPMQALCDLGHCLTRFPWVVMGFSNRELTHWSLGVGRIVLTGVSFGNDGEHLVLPCIRSGAPDWLMIPGDLHPEAWHHPILLLGGPKLLLLKVVPST